MAVEMTYVALKPLRVGGERRAPGELVPEAASWRRTSAWVDQGKITAVPKSMIDADELAKAEKAWQERVEQKRQAEETSSGDESTGDEVGEPAPDEQGVVEPSPEDQPELAQLDRAALRQLAEERGIEVDGRWSQEKLAEVIAEETGEE